MKKNNELLIKPTSTRQTHDQKVHTNTTEYNNNSKLQRRKRIYKQRNTHMKMK